MKIEKLNENKIRITFDIRDLEEKNVDFHSFMSNPIESQNLFLNMLEQAEKEVGFETKDCKILIEALATSNGNFVVTVTRVLPETENLNILPRKKIRVKRKTNVTNYTNSKIFEFASFDDFYDYCTSLQSNFINKINKELGSSNLYCYNSKYYLIIDKLSNNKDFIKSFYSSILEFAKLIINSSTYKNKISEHGKLIIKRNAIYKCNGKFKSKK